ncbi:anhydro-N-acetylmuramic acid kinase [Cytophaga aurantiaca]|uniref:anhydro-N-acetylmuramic acid kinase n=1 Tax=Cytophaga aurantiaca TaxID=29530 RepID=UPI00035EBE4D|nr:anhydro-N-acetylmuramic acid kinase [Cytophaga aurantiaca]
MKNKTYTVAGLMSGTSLDGLDIAVCVFEQKNNQWTYQTLAATTIEYSEQFKIGLNTAMKISGEELIALDRSFGAFQGTAVKKFITDHQLSIDLISAHGHTIFHNPAEGYTLQIGSGASLYAACNIPVVTDLRSVDVAFGGQGAPLVPLGDELLFGTYSGCLNLGGIANISYVSNHKNVAFDICPVNILLNAYTLKIGKSYDDGGRIAQSGKLIPALLQQFNDLKYYKQAAPKSIGREWVDAEVFPLIAQYATHPIEDILHTIVLHAAQQIASCLSALPVKEGKQQLLITGGGAFNTFLIESIKSFADKKIELIIPDANTIQFKEAIIFGFLGLLRMQNIPNAKSTVTGASVDTIGGAVYGNFNDFFS